MKKLLLSLISIFMIFTGVALTGCGGEPAIATITLESASFTNDRDNYIEIDVMQETEVTIKATIDNQDDGRVSVSNDYSDRVKVTTSYNANLNTNTITLKALEEGPAELIVSAMSGKVEKQKILVYVYSDITGLSQKVDDANSKKTQYIEMDKNVELLAESYLDIIARDTCNRKDIVWSAENNYGGSLVLVNNILRLDSDLFKAFQETEAGRDVNQITIKAQSRYVPEISTDVTFDILKGIDKSDCSVQAKYSPSGEAFDVYDASGNAILTELVRTNNADEKSTLYYTVSIVSENSLSWVALTDEVLFENFGIPTGTLDITKVGETYDSLTHLRTYTFKVINENSLEPRNYEFNFSFEYLDYDYTFSTSNVKIALIDVVTRIEVTSGAKEVLNGKSIDVYNVYADGKGQFFNTGLYPTSAKDTTFFVRLRVANGTANQPGFNIYDYIDVFVESGALIEFEKEEIEDPNYSYYISTIDEAKRIFANGTGIYVRSKKISSAFDIGFFSNVKIEVQTYVHMNFLYAPTENFEIKGRDGNPIPVTKIETSSFITKEITFQSSELAGINVANLYLRYPESNAYTISNLRKNLSELTFDVTLNQTNFNQSIEIVLCHKNGYEATSAIKVDFFKALTSAQVVLLNSTSSNISYYNSEIYQNFGGGNDKTLSELIVTYGSTISLQFNHNANESLKGINLYYFIDGENGVEDKDTIEEFYNYIYTDEDGDGKWAFDTLKESRNYFSYNQNLNSITFNTVRTSFTGYIVVEFVGFNDDHNETKLHRIIEIESYVPVSTLSTAYTLIEAVASDSVSADDAEILSKKMVQVRFRNDQGTLLEVTYPGFDNEDGKPYFEIYSATARSSQGASEGYTWDNNQNTLYYGGVPIYSLTDIVSNNGKYMTFIVNANTTADFTEFVDTLVIQYNSFSSTFRLGIDIKITNSQRVSSLIWENETDDGSVYLLLRANGDLTENNKTTIITTVSEAYNTDLIYYYHAVGGQSNIISFEDNGKYKDVIVNATASVGGYGYIYVLPEDAVKANNQIIFSYYDENNDIITRRVPLVNLNGSCELDTTQTWFEYLYNNAFFVTNSGSIVRYNQIMIRILLTVADGLSEETAIKIYTPEEINAMTYFNHYVLMNNVVLSEGGALFSETTPFTGSLRGYDDTVTITLDDRDAVFDVIGDDGVVKNLIFNGKVKKSIGSAGFVAISNKGLIENVTIDVYLSVDGYKSSTINESDDLDVANVGAIAGDNSGTIRNSKVLGVTLKGQTVGGIVGVNNGTIEGSVVEFYNFTDGANKFVSITNGNVGGLVGFIGSASSVITGSYVYDYTLTAETEPNLQGGRVGAFVGAVDLNQETANISNSFAFVGISNATGYRSANIKDCYISYYDASDDFVSTIIAETDASLWIKEGNDGFSDIINGGNQHLKFAQSQLVDVSTVVFKEDDSFIKINDEEAILYLYELDTHNTLTKAERNALTNRNTYELTTLFSGLENGLDEYVVVSTSDVNIVKANLTTLEVVDTGSVTITVLSKQDFSQTKTYTLEVIHIIADYKANYNGYETTGIEVQEGRSAQIDFTFLDGIYVNSAVKYDLVLDNFQVVTDGVDPSIRSYADYSVENNVGMLNIYSGAKNAVGSFTVNSYVTLSTLEEDLKEKVKERFNKVLTITPFEGTNYIGAEYSSITLYPALSSTFEVELQTDSSTDQLYISVEHNGVNLNVKTDAGVENASQIVSEEGDYVLAYGNLGDRLKLKVTRKSYDIINKKFVYKLTFAIVDEYKSSISKAENYTIVLNSKNDKEKTLTKRVELLLESQAIDNIDVTNYKLSQTYNENGVIKYTRTDIAISLVSPGTTSIMEVTIDPEFSYYEYLTLSYIPQNNELLTFTALNIDGQKYEANSSSNVTNIAYGVKITPSVKTSTFAFKVYVSQNISSDCVFPITVSFFGYNQNNELVVLEQREFLLYVTCIRQPNITVDGSEFAKLAKGSSGLVEINLKSDQSLESLVVEGNNVRGISLSLISVVDNEDGTKTHSYRIKARVTAQVDYNAIRNPQGVGQFGVKATVARVLNGVRETNSMTANVALIELDVSKVSVQNSSYNEDLGLEVFTAYENISKSFQFDYQFNPNEYPKDVTAEEEIAVIDLLQKQALLETYGHYPYYDTTELDIQEKINSSAYHINYTYDDETQNWTPIDLMNQIYVVGNNSREQKITWSLTSEVEQTYTYVHYEGSFARFKIVYEKPTGEFTITGSSTTSDIVRMRLKNITYLETAGKDVYWESTYDFGVEVKSYTDDDSPEAINNVKDFIDIKNQGEAKPYILMNDIVLEDYEPFATDKITSFDGNGFTIYLNSFDQTVQEGSLDLALFTSVSQNTTLKNVRVNWYNGGQITVDTSLEDGFSTIQVAGLAISNSGIIYNCEVVSFYNEDYNTKLTDETKQGIVISYIRNDIPYTIDGNSSVNSVVAGLVLNNDGNITNSRVGGETLRVINETTGTGISYFKEITLDTFTILAQREINGFVSQNSGYISASKATNLQIVNEATYNQFETAGFVNSNSGVISSSYVAGKDQPKVYANIETSISTIGVVAGFVVNNATTGYITDCMSNILISTTSLFGSGFVYKNEGEVIYSFSASQVENSSYTQMGFTGLDKNGNLLSSTGKISFSYYYDLDFSEDSDLENKVDTGAAFLDLQTSNSPSNYYGFSFATGEKEEEMLENSDGIWYITEEGKVSIISADTVAYSSRYIAGENTNNSFLYVYSDMVNNDTESIDFNQRYSTQYGSRYNPIIIANADDFDAAMGTSTSTNISRYFNASEIFGSYRFVNNISLDELDKNKDGDVFVASTSKVLTTKTFATNGIDGRGQIDGNGFKISNISIATNANSNIGEAQSFGLFAKLDNGAKILNLSLGVTNVTADDVYVVGSLAGLVNNSSVVNVTVEQSYSVSAETTPESSDEGVIGQNIVGGVIGAVTGVSMIKNVTIENALVQVAYYDSLRLGTDFYIDSINLRNNRTNIISDSSKLAMFSQYSIAGGIIGYVDVFNADQRLQTNYVHLEETQRTYRIKNMIAHTTVNVRGEVVGGLFGFTGPTTFVDNVALKLTVDEESNTYISKILSYDAYAGGITGLGYGYYHRVLVEHDDDTQDAIEAAYPDYYSGDEEANRGLLDVFYSTYAGSVVYDYNPQAIGGLIGVMIGGEIINSYSKINVLAKPMSQTTAGGIVGRISHAGSAFTFILNSSTDGDTATTSNVFLQEVFATGDVRGGYDEDANKGYGGGIVGVLDRNAIVGLEAVNAVNAFGYYDILTAVEGEGDPIGHLSSVGVYAFVGGSENERGTIRIIAPAKYSSVGEITGISTKSVGYFAKIDNAQNEQIKVDTWPGLLRVEYVTPSVVSYNLQPYKINSVSDFINVEDGYNSVLSAFIVGGHWSPNNWNHTGEEIYPVIRYTSYRTYYYLDNYGPYAPENVVRKMRNSNIQVRVRGLCSDGTYANVNLSEYTIENFSGSIIGPDGWLSSEEKEKKVIAHGSAGETIGICLDSAVFSNVRKGFVARDLKVIYGSDSQNKRGEGATNLEVTNSKPNATSSGGAFISGIVDEATLSNLTFKTEDYNVEISAENGNAGFIASYIRNSVVEGIAFDVRENDNVDPAKPAFTFKDDYVGESTFNAGLITGLLEVARDKNVAENRVRVANRDISIMAVNLHGERSSANIGALFGYATALEGAEGEDASLMTIGFSATDLISISGGKKGTTEDYINVGGQVGKIEDIDNLYAFASDDIETTEDTSVINVNIMDDMNLIYGGVVGSVNALNKFELAGIGYIAHTTLGVLTSIGKIKAGGVFGSVQNGTETLEVKSLVENERLNSYFGLYDSSTGEVGEGSVGGVVGDIQQSMNIAGINAEIQTGGSLRTDDISIYNDFTGLNANVGGVIGQNSSVLSIENLTTSGKIRASGTAYVSGVVALNSETLTIGASKAVTSSVNITTSLSTVGGMVSYVDEGATTDIKDALYTGTIQLYGETTSFTVGGIVGYAKSKVTISNAGFGGKVVLLGDAFGHEGIDEKVIKKEKINMVVGGIIGQDQASSSIDRGFSYGDLIVHYGDYFKQFDELNSGGIVGISNATTIKNCVSIFTNNNDRLADTHNVAPIWAAVDGGGSAPSYENNYYSSALTLCVQDEATDMAYKTSYTTEGFERKGYNGSEVGETALETIETCIREFGDEYWTSATEEQGSKLNPFTAGAETYTFSTPIVYIVAEGNGNINEGRFNINNTGTYSFEDEYGSLSSASYNVAFIGDGFEVGYIYNAEDTVHNSSQAHAIYNTMQQNDIVSSVVFNVDIEYDFSDDTNTNAGVVAGTMEGGVVYATGAYGSLSVGGEKAINVAGLAGNMKSGLITDSYASVHVTYRGSTDTYLGTASGFTNLYGADYAYINNSFSTGKVETYNSANVYMFAGSTAPSSGETPIRKIKNSYTISPIERNDHTRAEEINGALQDYGEEITLDTCYTDVDSFRARVLGTEETTAYIAVNFAELASEPEIYSDENFTGWTYDGKKNYGYPMRNYSFLQRSTVKKVEVEVASGVTEEKEFHLIPNAGKLAQISSGLDLNYILEYDIDLTKTSSYASLSQPLISIIDREESYQGIFDGNNKTIIGLKIHIGSAISKSYGLFESLQGATISDLKLTDVDIKSTVQDDEGHVGALAGHTVGSTIYNVSADGHMEIATTEKERDFPDSAYYKASKNSVGGIVGFASSTSFETCKNYVKIEREEGTVGGIVGDAVSLDLTNFFEYKEIKNCYNYAPLQVNKCGTVGGIVGALQGEYKLVQCGNTNSILCGYTEEGNGNFFAGGIVGKICVSIMEAEDVGIAIINECYNTAMVKAGNKANTTMSYAGGIVAANLDVGDNVVTEAMNKVEISYCLNQGPIEAIASTASATTKYSIVSDSGKYYVEFTYGGTRNVYASSIVGTIPGISENSLNYGEVFQNGLFGTKTIRDITPVNFNISGNRQSFNGTYKIKKEKQIGEIYNYASDDTSWASYIVGSTSQANVFIQGKDDLGGPKFYYLTVPRFILYPIGTESFIENKSGPLTGLDMVGDVNGVVRAQEIYFSSTIRASLEGKQTYYDAAHVNECYNEATSDYKASTETIWTQQDGQYYLTFMDSFDESDPDMDYKTTRIAGSLYAVADSAETLHSALSENFERFEVTYGGNIGGETIKKLNDAGYKFGIVLGTIPTQFTSLRGTASYDADSENLKVTFIGLCNNRDGSSINIPYSIEAYREDHVISETLQASSVYFDDANEKTEIYLGTLGSFEAEEDGSVKEAETIKTELEEYNGLTFVVTIFNDDPAYTKEIDMLYDSTGNKFVVYDGTDKTNYVNDWQGCKVKFNLLQNKTLTTQEISSVLPRKEIEINLLEDYGATIAILNKTDATGNTTVQTEGVISDYRDIEIDLSGTPMSGTSYFVFENENKEIIKNDDYTFDKSIQYDNSSSGYTIKNPTDWSMIEEYDDAVDGYTIKAKYIWQSSTYLGSAVQTVAYGTNKTYNSSTILNSYGTSYTNTTGTIDIDGLTYQYSYDGSQYKFNNVSGQTGSSGQYVFGFVINDNGTTGLADDVLELTVTTTQGSINGADGQPITFAYNPETGKYYINGVEYSSETGVDISVGDYSYDFSFEHGIDLELTLSTRTYTYDAIFEEISEVVIDSSKTFAGEEITITSASKPGIVVDAGIEAREYGTAKVRYKITQATNEATTEEGDQIKATIKLVKKPSGILSFTPVASIEEDWIDNSTFKQEVIHDFTLPGIVNNTIKDAYYVTFKPKNISSEIDADGNIKINFEYDVQNILLETKSKMVSIGSTLTETKDNATIEIERKYYFSKTSDGNNIRVGGAELSTSQKAQHNSAYGYIKISPSDKVLKRYAFKYDITGVYDDGTIKNEVSILNSDLIVKKMNEVGGDYQIEEYDLMVQLCYNDTPIVGSDMTEGTLLINNGDKSRISIYTGLIYEDVINTELTTTTTAQFTTYDSSANVVDTKNLSISLLGDGLKSNDDGILLIWNSFDNAKNIVVTDAGGNKSVNRQVIDKYKVVIDNSCLDFTNPETATQFIESLAVLENNTQSPTFADSLSSAHLDQVKKEEADEDITAETSLEGEDIKHIKFNPVIEDMEYEATVSFDSFEADTSVSHTLVAGEAVTGIILMADVDLGIDKDVEGIANISGNGYSINYYAINNSMFEEASGHIKHLNVAGAIYLFQEASIGDTHMGILAKTFDEGHIKCTNTYGSITIDKAQSRETLRPYKTSGLVPKIKETNTVLEDVRSYVNFASYKDNYKADVTHDFIGISYNKPSEINGNLTNYGTIIGYDGLDPDVRGKSGYRGTSIATTLRYSTTVSGVPTPHYIGNNLGVAIAGKGGMGAPGYDGRNGTDYTGSSYRPLSQGTDGQEGALDGKEGSVDGAAVPDPTTRGKTGCSGWDGMNLYNYRTAVESGATITLNTGEESSYAKATLDISDDDGATNGAEVTHNEGQLIITGSHNTDDPNNIFGEIGDWFNSWDGDDVSNTYSASLGEKNIVTTNFFVHVGAINVEFSQSHNFESYGFPVISDGVISVPQGRWYSSCSHKATYIQTFVFAVDVPKGVNGSTYSVSGYGLEHENLEDNLVWPSSASDTYHSQCDAA